MRKPKHDSMMYDFNQAQFRAIKQSILTQHTQAVHQSMKFGNKHYNNTHYKRF